MPSKNSKKIYVENGIYHLYNRGAEKRDIFLDEQDYKVFLYYLKSYLSGSHPEFQGATLKLPTGIRRLPEFNLCKNIKLFAYCLMPNHFHLMIKQTTGNAMIEFMRRLSNAYVKYFNEKYDRTGTLFQGRYKAVLIENESYFLHLSRYIHLNPRDNIINLENYQYSSYLEYIGKRNATWVYKDEIMEYFKNNQDSKNFSSYQDFVESGDKDNKQIINNLTLD